MSKSFKDFVKEQVLITFRELEWVYSDKFIASIIALTCFELEEIFLVHFNTCNLITAMAISFSQFRHVTVMMLLLDQNFFRHIPEIFIH